MIDIPTSISPRELEVMLREAKGKRVVEFGALLGYSTVALAHVATKVVSVDKHEGYGAPTLPRFMSNLDRYGVRHKVEVRVTSVENSDNIWGDVGFIDLNGQFETTKAALMKCWCPVIMLHDTCRAYCEGVEKALKERCLVPITHVDSLTVCLASDMRNLASYDLRKQGY